MSTSAIEVVEGTMEATNPGIGVLRPVERPASQAVLRPVEVRPGLLRRLLLTAPRIVLFVCVENAARSLMAESVFNADPAPGWRATSAGTRPWAGA